MPANGEVLSALSRQRHGFESRMDLKNLQNGYVCCLVWRYPRAVSGVVPNQVGRAFSRSHHPLSLLGCPGFDLALTPGATEMSAGAPEPRGPARRFGNHWFAPSAAHPHFAFREGISAVGRRTGYCASPRSLGERLVTDRRRAEGLRRSSGARRRRGARPTGRVAEDRPRWSVQRALAFPVSRGRSTDESLLRARSSRLVR